ncbi:class I adenylate-forming enzyme family protein [Desulfosarcina ovata]|uniref:Long-chain fatty acid--CoA ligase n=1 Tax=Desulfosarcina ovata subsp. ovata TaxID=2752305 RepID=A0A5K8ALK4_9BACT|nr:AMP-binding protein [Desulfosarcina ovata]BBO93439.1 long-chain fatty acid--CoA ligase [Desulfosarcina ovata subsp. ovata]
MDRYACWQQVWPEGVPQNIEADKPFTEYFRDRATERPDAVAIYFYGYEIDYATLNRKIDQFANALIDRGLNKGDRVGVFLQNSPHYVISFFGVIRAGGIVVNLNPMFKAMELDPIIEKTGIETIIVQDSLFAELNKTINLPSSERVIVARLSDYIPENPQFSPPPEALGTNESFPGTVDFQELIASGKPESVCRIDDMDADLAMLQLTGGTTGVPKAAMISVRAFTLAVLINRAWYRLTTADTSLGVAPFFHIMGLQATMVPCLVSGCTLLVITRFDPQTIARVIAERGCSVWVAAPTMLTDLVNMPEIEGFDFSSLRVIVTGGSPISLSLQQRIKALAPNSQLGEGYGMTEILASGGVHTPLGRWKEGFCGIPMINDLKIVDLEMGEKEMPPNQEGEIVIKGSTVMQGYWNQPEETRDVFRDGWFYTGDIGFLDEEGYLKIVDRKKELILCSGFNVYPSDLENIMSRHPAILEVAVIGVPDDYRGESPKAIVILKDEYQDKVTEKDIVDWCRENMASYKRPREVEFQQALPKSGAGKILKRLLN